MLQLIRERAQGIIVWIILGFVILSLGSFILYGYSPETGKNYVAKVNGDTIGQQEYQQAYNQFQQGMGANLASDPRLQEYIKQTIINGLVDRRLAHQMLDSAGFRVSPQLIAKQVEGIPNFHDANGKFSADTYHDLLRSKGMTAQGFEQQLGYDYSLQQLRQSIEGSGFALGYQAAELERLQNQQRDLGYKIFSSSALMPTVKVGDDEIKAYYTAHTDQFMTDEAVRVQYIELSVKALAQTIAISDADLKDYFEKNKASYTREDTSAADKKIQDIQQRLKKGESFAKLAELYSQDPGSAKKGGDLGLFGRGAMVKPFEDTVFSLKPGEVSKPVKTEFGVHLIKLEAIKGEQRQARHILIKSTKVNADFASVKDKVRQDVQTQRAEQAFYEQADQLDKLSYQNQDSLEPAAEKLKLKIQDSDFYTRRGGPQLFSDPQVLSATFSDPVLNRNLNSDVIKIGNDRVVVLRVKEHHAAAQRPLEQVKAMIEARLRSDKAKEETYTQAKAAYDKLITGGSADSLTGWTRTGFIGRTAKTEADAKAKDTVSNEIRQIGFHLSKPVDANKANYAVEKLPNGDSAIVGVYAVRDSANGIAVDATHLRQLSQQQGQADLQMLLSYLRKHGEIDIKAPKKDE